jgi:nitrate reductase NapE component
MIKLDKKTKDSLLELYRSKNVMLEGNILKLIESEEGSEFGDYLKECGEKDVTTRKKRLEITKRIQTQNNELTKWKEENIRIQEELVNSLDETKKSKEEAELLKKEAEKARDDAEKARDDAEKARDDAESARILAESAKSSAENDLEMIQKRSQFELIGTIVKVALWVIISVGIVTTGVFLVSLFTNKDTAIVGSTWSNIVGILLTNAFSIVGTIMGVKYASEKN